MNKKTDFDVVLVVIAVLSAIIVSVGSIKDFVDLWDGVYAWMIGGGKLSSSLITNRLLLILVLLFLAIVVLLARLLVRRRIESIRLSELPEVSLEQRAAERLINQDVRSDEDQQDDPASAAWWNEKYYDSYIGHESDLERIAEFFRAEDNPKALLISAIGGIGKTAFSRELTERLFREKSFLQIAWIRARLEQFDLQSSNVVRRSRLTTVDAMRDIAVELRIPHWPIMNEIELKRNLKAYLRENRCLIVIDGLEDAESPQILARDLREILGVSRLLINSRQKISSDLAASFELPKLAQEESLLFLSEVSKEKYAIDARNPILKSSPKTIRRIIEIADGMPLALKLVISQADFMTLERIAQRLSSIEEMQLYNYIFESSWKELEIRQEVEAQQVLIVLAARDKSLWVDTLYGVGGMPNADLDKGLNTLRRHSLIEFSDVAGRRRVGMHSLTRQYVNNVLARKLSDQST